MNTQQMRETVELTDVKPLKINGVEISAEVVKSTFFARIWRSATVVKNKREADKGGLKATVGQALNAELITAEEGLTILLTGDKEKINSLREQLPTVEKSVEPSEDDVKIAIQQVQANKGQAS